MGVQNIDELDGLIGKWMVWINGKVGEWNYGQGDRHTHRQRQTVGQTNRDTLTRRKVGLMTDQQSSQNGPGLQPIISSMSLAKRFTPVAATNNIRIYISIIVRIVQRQHGTLSDHLNYSVPNV